MSITLEIGTKNYLDDLLCIKKHLSHMESLLNCYASYTLSERNNYNPLQNLVGHFLN